MQARGCRIASLQEAPYSNYLIEYQAPIDKNLLLDSTQKIGVKNFTVVLYMTHIWPNNNFVLICGFNCNVGWFVTWFFVLFTFKISTGLRR